MTLTIAVSTKELARVAAAAYEGESVRVSLHNVGITGYTEESTIASWDTVKLAAANGYADFVLDPIPAGGFDGIEERYEIGDDGVNSFITAEFTGSGSGFTYDTVVVRIGSATYPHSVLTEDPAITVAAGETRSYAIQLLAAVL